MNTKNWFETWFDSPYYHILYKNRNDHEASFFLNNLLTHFKDIEGKTGLDLACGKGRHSIYLNSKGLKIKGIDISPQSIAFAKQFENDNLHFLVHDMRKPLLNESFDYIFNLFTSFGYFDTYEENLATLVSIKSMLNPNGIIVIDFMNTAKVVNSLVANEIKTLEEIEFNLSRKVDNGKIIKDIVFEANRESFHFQERVSAIYYDDFISLFNASNIELIDCFGNYGLDPYDTFTSDRMIFIARSKE